MDGRRIMSSDTLTWLLTKNTSSFLVKRNGNEFAREKFNLLNRNCRKYSGLASTKAVDVSLADKKVTLTTKIEKAAKKPVKAENAVPLRKGARGGANTIRANISRNYYRRDLKKAALAKWSRLSTVAKVEKGASPAVITGSLSCRIANLVCIVIIHQVSSRRRPSAAVASRLKRQELQVSSAALRSMANVRTARAEAAMPFLRSLDDVRSSRELRSSKTLIGSAAATCDVVVTGDDVLELHALLNLAADKASAKLVPFSTTDAGVCYVNDVVVPREGAIVVHGDRVAFGHPRNAFLFELTPHPQMKATPAGTAQQSTETEHSILRSADPRSSGANRVFRRALDTLRGDRKATIPDPSVVSSIQSNLTAIRNRGSAPSTDSLALSPSTSKDQLSKFLLEASTDSLLSDYVERKLKQRQSGSRTRSRQSSVTSSLNRESRLTDRVHQSRQERNVAEIEKLRLSQRIREVNDVRLPKLSCDVPQRLSYLSPSAKSVRNRQPLWTNDHHDPMLGSIDNVTVSNNNEDDEEDDEDDLPAMMEKRATPLSVHLSPGVSASIKTENSEQDSSSHPLGHEKTENVEQKLQGHVKAEEPEQELPSQLQHQTLPQPSVESLPVSDSYASLHEQENKRQSYNSSKARGFFAKAMSLGLNDLTRSNSRPTNPGQQEAKAIVRRHLAFRRWELLTQQHRVKHQLNEVQHGEQSKIDAHLERISERHYLHKSVQPLLSQILRRWSAISANHKKRLHILRKVFLHSTSKLLLRAWTKWNENTRLEQKFTVLKTQTEQRIQQMTERFSNQHNQMQRSMRESHAEQLQKLMELIEEKDHQLEEIKRQQRAEALEKVRHTKTNLE
ncbi:unnamed protein product [Phytophthora fragariaefolia]|uniref:Unnamed protein product n=1 Tax=Phytophthora fragariaefolia TaxID=1490495 RepID=A0A9W6TSV4_9STRA|nr:unnamed protein product [Phytophthora fragariaefolia]